MKIWFDTEFIEDGRTIELISIGMVREDGRKYYAEAGGVDYTRASPWVRENVIPKLFGGTSVVSRSQMANEIRSFAGELPEFWAYYADYDRVVLCQLYGTMTDLPKGWPMYCRDLKQLSDMMMIDIDPGVRGGNPHHALSDALWVREAHLKLWKKWSKEIRI